MPSACNWSMRAAVLAGPVTRAGRRFLRPGVSGGSVSRMAIAQVASEAVQQQVDRPDPSPTRSGHPLPPSLETGEGIMSPSRGIVPACSPEDPLPGRPIQAQVGTITTSDQSALSRCRDNAEYVLLAHLMPGGAGSAQISQFGTQRKRSSDGWWPINWAVRLALGSRCVTGEYRSDRRQQELCPAAAGQSCSS
jgi:hypothetical protein